MDVFKYAILLKDFVDIALEHDAKGFKDHRLQYQQCRLTKRHL